MRLKLDFITNSSSVNYTLADTIKNREELIVTIEGMKFNLFEELDLQPNHKFKTLEDLENKRLHSEEYPGRKKDYEIYKKLIEEGKIIYEFWTDGNNGLVSAYFYHNHNCKLPDGIEYVPVHLGG